MAKQLIFANRVINFDQKATQLAYSKIEKSCTEGLAKVELTDNLKYFFEIQNKIFNEDIKIFFKTIGIDINKETDFVHYESENYLFTEIKFDYLGSASNSKNKKPMVYEISDYTINVHFTESQNGKHRVFSDKQTNRIEITIIQKTEKTRDNKR